MKGAIPLKTREMGVEGFKKQAKKDVLVLDKFVRRCRYTDAFEKKKHDVVVVVYEIRFEKHQG